HIFSFAAKIAGAALRPIATQGRSYKDMCLPPKKRNPGRWGNTPGAKRKPLGASRDSLASAGAKHWPGCPYSV
ncbi:hypothetical protein, partial [Pseudomonas asiatica]|uniref:hypothetical protein n=1 Tax=Pseudomonas asiatica TaxID=2219225 RepID=UPI003B9588D6